MKNKESKYHAFSIFNKKQNKYENKIRKFFGCRKKLSFNQRIAWFIHNYYETGMEYEILLDSLTDEELDNLEWYNEIINIPKYLDQVK